MLFQSGFRDFGYNARFQIDIYMSGVCWELVPVRVNTVANEVNKSKMSPTGS